MIIKRKIGERVIEFEGTVEEIVQYEKMSYVHGKGSIDQEQHKNQFENTPFQQGIIDAVLYSGTKKVVVMAASQIGKTHILKNIASYYTDIDPSPILQIEPNNLHNTIENKPVRILLADEVDRLSNKDEDYLLVAEKRTRNFYNKKVVLVSTPTIKGISRIEEEFEWSTQEYWNLPCPSCGEYQPLKWDQIRLNSATHVCLSCGSNRDESEWKEGEGKWLAKNPAGMYRGFHLSALVSPWVEWADIIREYKEALDKGRENRMKYWTNSQLGEPWPEDVIGIKNNEHFPKARNGF